MVIISQTADLWDYRDSQRRLGRLVQDDRKTTVTQITSNLAHRSRTHNTWKLRQWAPAAEDSIYSHQDRINTMVQSGDAFIALHLWLTATTLPRYGHICEFVIVFSGVLSQFVHSFSCFVTRENKKLCVTHANT